MVIEITVDLQMMHMRCSCIDTGNVVLYFITNCVSLIHIDMCLVCVTSQLFVLIQMRSFVLCIYMYIYVTIIDD